MADLSKIVLPNNDEYTLKDTVARAASATMTGATSQSAGTGGTVPLPAAGDQDKFLRADGIWADGGHPMAVLVYGTSTWQEFIDAYNGHYIVYCRTGGRMAFMAYVNKDGVNPTEVEFQYYRSVSTKSDTQQGDETYIYKLTNANGGTWTTTTRKNFTRVVAGTNLSSTYSSQQITLNLNVANETAASGGTTLSLVTTGEKYTWNNKASTSVATTSSAGLMSSSDKTKLDGIAEGATANLGTITGITMNGESKGTSGVIDLGTVLTSHQDISGKVSGPASSTDSTVAVFDGTTGKIIKDSGYTIGVSVPSNAVFTDTTYTSKTASAGGTEVSLVTTGEKAIWNAKVNSSDVGVASGVASLNSSGKVPDGQIPDSVHDILEYTEYSLFPLEGETGKQYIDKSTNQIYRWSGTAYVGIGGGTVPVMTGATSSTNGATGTVPAPLAGDQSKFLKGDGTWDNVPDPQTMTGATSSTAGTGGLVPAPASGEQSKFLKGDGTWAYVPATPPPPDFMGATAQMPGSSGLVPAPAAGDQSKFLKGDGTWDNVPAAQTMTGATSSSDGTGGLVPAPLMGDEGKVLMGSGTWETLPTSLPSGGASGTVLQKNSATDYDVSWGTINSLPSGGTSGTVLTKNSATDYDVTWGSLPEGIPSGGSAGAFLKKNSATDYDVTWGTVNIDNVIKVTTAIAIPASGSSASYNVTGLTANHELIRWNFSSSAENWPPVNLTVTTYAGYFTIQNTSGTTSETIKPMFAIPVNVTATSR